MPWMARAITTRWRLLTNASMSDELMMMRLPRRMGRLRPTRADTSRTNGSHSSWTMHLDANRMPRTTCSCGKYSMNGAIGTMTYTVDS